MIQFDDNIPKGMRQQIAQYIEERGYLFSRVLEVDGGKGFRIVATADIMSGEIRINRIAKMEGETKS